MRVGDDSYKAWKLEERFRTLVGDLQLNSQGTVVGTSEYLHASSFSTRMLLDHQLVRTESGFRG